MERVCSKKLISDTVTRYRARIESDPCLANTQESRHVQYNLLRTLVDSPDLLACGPVVFERMTMAHTGTRWIVELEARVEESDVK